MILAYYSYSVVDLCIIERTADRCQIQLRVQSPDLGPRPGAFRLANILPDSIFALGNKQVLNQEVDLPIVAEFCTTVEGFCSIQQHLDNQDRVDQRIQRQNCVLVAEKLED